MSGDEDDTERASPTCSLSEAPARYAFAGKLSREEIAALLAELVVSLRAGDAAQAENRIRESLPLIGDDTLRASLAAMAEGHSLTVSELERLSQKITSR